MLGITLANITPIKSRPRLSLQEMADAAKRPTAQQMKDRVLIDRKQVSVPEWMRRY